MPRDRPGATQGRPRSHADGPRTGPERLKTAPRGPKKPPEAPRRAWDRFPSDLERCWWPWDLEKPQKVLYCRRFSWFSRFRKGAFNRGPRSSKRSPPGDPNEPQAQERTKGAPSLQGALREPILASSWGPRGLIFELSRRPFRRSRAVHHTNENTVRNHWSKGLSRPLRARCAEAIVH